MSENEGSNDNDLAVGSLVSINGLQTDAGKALKGSSGIILGPSKEDKGVRYPVLLYAVISDDEDSGEPKLKLLQPPMKRKIKDVNMTEKADQKCKLYKWSCQEHAQDACSGVPDYKAAVFWLAGYYERWPEDDRMAITYANMLRSFCKEPQEAWRILRETVPMVEPTDPTINESRYDACVTCCAADGDAEEALHWALQIETDTDDRKQLALEALQEVRKLCRGNFKRTVDMDSGDGPLLEVHLRVAQAMFEIMPENPECIFAVGSAHCLLENNQEGVRWYRRTLATGKFYGDNEDKLKKDLACAMMQCPGGMMEDYRVLGMSDEGFRCIHKSSIGQYTLHSQGDCNGRFGGIIQSTGPEQLELVIFPFPDIDDDEFFNGVDIPPRENE